MNPPDKVSEERLRELRIATQQELDMADSGNDMEARRFWTQMKDALLELDAHRLAERATAEDYEAVLADHRRLVRELDVLLHGEGAAKQASLCDIVAQVAAQKRRSHPAERADGECARNHLLRLIDDVWQAATDSQEVPSVAWADELLDKWTGKQSLPAPPAEPSHKCPQCGWVYETHAPDCSPAERAKDDEFAHLLKFYNVATLEEVIRAQSQHIARLQAKLPPTPDTQPRNYREG